MSPHYETVQDFKSYLSDRLQFVKVVNRKSTNSPVTSGVPQGSILGPLLFPVFINDLPETVFNAKVFLFDDGLKLLYNENFGNKHGIKQDLDSILRSSYEYNISFNLSKCQYINFNIKARLSPVLGQWSLEQSRTVEDLGFTMNDSLTCKEHVELRTRKAKKFFHQIKRNRSYCLTVSAKLKLYKSTLIPILIYGSNCYMP